MSGHSKWATIHRAKEAKDAKKGAAFTKLAAAITMAVKQGGGIGDPEKNFKLRLAVEKARQYNMPKENVARSIEKGMGAGAGVALEEVLFEGFLPGGAGVLVEAVTDNHLRTGQAVRMILDKNGGSMGSSGAVAYMFEQKGEVVVDLGDKNGDEAELQFIDFGVEDVELMENKLVTFCNRDKTFEIKDLAEKAGYKVESAGLTMRPTATVEVKNEEQRDRIENILEQLEDLDDVTNVWSNYTYA
jgi:YebC/PmpR family DNA-binding regulatory protein